MRKSIISIVLSLTIFICGYGQNVRLVNQNVSNERSRTIYIGIENKFLVTDSLVTGMEPHENVSLSENRLIIRPTSPGYLTLTFLKGQEKAQVIFYGKNIPQPIVLLGNQKGSKVRKDSLITNPWIGVGTDANDGFFQGYVVESCKAMLGGEEFNSGGNFSDALKNAIRTTKSGDQLVISEIKLFNEKVKKTVSGGTYKFIIE